MTKDEFKRARNALLDGMRADVRLTPAARLIGWEILMLLNYDTGDAWPSHEYLQDKLGIGLRTVKRAVAEFGEFDIFTVELRGRKNFYRPSIGANLAPNAAENRARKGAEKGATRRVNSASDRGHQPIEKGAKTDPLSPYPPSNETLHYHQHQHLLLNDADGGGGIAAALTNALLKLAGIRLTEPAFGRQELGIAQRWLALGMDVKTVLQCAEMQMARKRKGSSAHEPIHTIGYFEPELMKLFAPLLNPKGEAAA
jgi:hypothetical protein